MGQVDLRGVESLDQMHRRLKDGPNNSPIVRGHGYNQVMLKERRHPRLDELDTWFPNTPVVLAHSSGHMVVANSLALQLAGVDKHRDDPPGGRIGRDVNGNLTGLLEENAQGLMVEALPKPTIGELEEAIGRASRLYAEWGLTSTQEAGVGWHSEWEWAAWQNGWERGTLRNRVSLMPDVQTLNLRNPGPPLYEGMRTGFGNDWLRLGPVKIFSDGSMIGHTAAMHDPYENSEERGFLIYQAAELMEMVERLHGADWQIAIHAIGDRAIDTVLDAYAHALEQYPKDDHRHRIEHAGVLTDRALARVARLGVIPISQQHFIGELGDTFRANVGDRTAISYRQKSLIDAGLPLAGSSDCFVVDGRPLLGMHDAVNQRTASGAAYAPHEALTPYQALSAYTKGSAYVQRAERIKGMLMPTMLADFVVLDRDPLGVDPRAIDQIKVVATFAGGHPTYQA